MKWRRLPGFLFKALANWPENFPGTKVGKFLAQTRRKEPLLLRIGEYFRAAPEDGTVGERSPQNFTGKLAPVRSTGDALDETESGEAKFSRGLW